MNQNCELIYQLVSECVMQSRVCYPVLKVDSTLRHAHQIFNNNNAPPPPNSHQNKNKQSIWDLVVKHGPTYSSQLGGFLRPSSYCTDDRINRKNWSVLNDAKLSRTNKLSEHWARCRASAVSTRVRFLCYRNAANFARHLVENVQSRKFSQVY